MKRIIYLFISAVLLSPFVGGSIALVMFGLFAVSMIPTGVQGALMMSIPAQDAASLFTKKLIAVYKEQVTVTSFLRSFFTPIESMTKEVSIAVRRGKEKVAVDVQRFSDGNRNTFSRSSEKIFVPPYFDEYLTANDHRLYDMVITSLSQGSTTMFAEMTAELAEDVMELTKKIERAIELQCAQVLETGIVTLAAGTNIDFQRKAGSLIDKGAGNYWATGTVSPYDDLEAGCNFLRQTGKSQGSVFNAILGSEALSDLLGNTIVKERADIRSFSLDGIREPQRNSIGGTIHGEISCGAYKVRLWTYPEFYDNSSDVSTPYVNEKKVILLPEAPQFKLAFAAVPQLITNGSIPQKGAYLVQEFFDEKATAHEIHVKSAPIAVPVAVDQIYTVQVVA